MKCFSLLFFLILSMTLYGQVTFTSAPTLTKDVGGTYWVEFTLSALTDVEVSIVDLKDSSVVRHLSAGMLGANAVPPLASASTHQKLAWDGKNDLGVAVANADSCKARVRAGMDFKLWNIIGDNPYAFNSKVGGLALDASGNVFIFGVHGTLQSTTIRAYDNTGNYVRTLFPVPAGQAPSNLTGWGIVDQGGGVYSPKTTFLASPTVTTSLVGNLANTILPFTRSGEMYAVSIPDLDFSRIGLNGNFTGTGATAKLITSPAMPGHYDIAGPVLVSLSSNGNYFLVSGIYQFLDSGTVDTGFWQDGRVYKVNATTGTASIMIQLSGVPKAGAPRQANIGPQYFGGGASSYKTMAAIHGTAMDDSGHIFICDRLHQEIGVYDTLGNRLGGVTVVDPDLVEVNKATGELYVATRRLDGYHTGLVNIRKYTGWRTGATLAAKRDSIVTGVGEVFASPYAEKIYMVVSTTGAKPLIWFTSYSGSGAQKSVWAIRDDGSALTIVKDFYQLSQGQNLGYDRVIVDRRHDVAYVNDGWSGLFKVEWQKSKALLPCSTTTGPLYGTEVAFGYNGLMYVREGTGYSGPITRYTSDHLHAPAPFANTGTNVMTPYIYSRYGQGYGEHGFGVDPQGRLAIMYMWTFAKYFVGALGDSGQRVTGQVTGDVDSLVMPIDGGYIGCGGVRFDVRGNLYIGVSIRSPSHQIPAAFASDWGYQKGVGAVVRYPKGVHGSVNTTSQTAPGSDKIYLPGMAPLSGTSGECACRSPRFDVDPYGRLFIPNCITSKVTIIDNNDNTIGSFGSYGNLDSRGFGSLITQPDIPLAWPTGAGASEDYVYVSDLVNDRLVQVKMKYALDNMQGLTDHNIQSVEGDAPSTAFALSSSPVPFNPSSLVKISLSSPGFTKLAVYSVTGAFIRTVYEGSLKTGVHHFVWDAKDQKGRTVSTGMYVYRLTSGNKVLSVRTILAK